MTTAFLDARIRLLESGDIQFEKDLASILHRNRARLLEILPSASATVGDVVHKRPRCPRSRKQPTQPTPNSIRLQQLPKPAYCELKDSPVKRRMSSGSEGEQEVSAEQQWQTHIEMFPATHNKPELVKSSKYMAEVQKTAPSNLRWIGKDTFNGLVRLVCFLLAAVRI